MEYQLYKNIVTHPDICYDKAILKGTRITVQTIAELVLSGKSDMQILKGYPRFTADDISISTEFVYFLLEKPTLVMPKKMVG